MGFLDEPARAGGLEFPGRDFAEAAGPRVKGRS